MMKGIIFAVALAVSGVASAETINDTAPTSDAPSADRAHRQRAIGAEVGRIHLDVLIDTIVSSDGEKGGDRNRLGRTSAQRQ